MNELVAVITTGITAFSATNIDNLLLLMLFFAQVNATFRRQHIFIGLFLGFTAIIGASLPGFLGGLILPQHWIRVLGLVPIALGLSRLLKGEEDSSEQVEIRQTTPSILSMLSPQTCSVAAVMFANGSDNIGVYAPIFADSTVESLLILLGVFLLLLGVEYYVADQLTQQSQVANVLTRYGTMLVPSILVGLGVFIVWESTMLSFVASGFCLILTVLLQRGWRHPWYSFVNFLNQSKIKLS